MPFKKTKKDKSEEKPKPAKPDHSEIAKKLDSIKKEETSSKKQGDKPATAKTAKKTGKIKKIRFKRSPSDKKEEKKKNT